MSNFLVSYGGLLIRYRSGYKCEGDDCNLEFEVGRSNQYETRLNAHHLDHNPENNVLSNGKALCTGCHVREHGGIESRLSTEEKASARRLGWENRKKNGNINSTFAGLTFEQRSEMAKRGAETRRRNKENADE